MPPPTFTVYAEDFSRNGASPRRVGEFPTAEEARVVAKARVTADLATYARPGQSAAETLKQWQLFGEDVSLVPDSETAPFSAVAFAQAIVGGIVIV